MTKPVTTTNQLTRLDKFALVSGIIGLVADVVSLAGVFVFTHGDSGSVSLPVWILIAFAIVYTSFITGIYARRFFATRNRKRNKTFTSEQLSKIESAVFVTNALITGSLGFAYATTLVLLNPNWTADSMAMAETGLGVVILYTIGTFVVVILMDQASRIIYEALDPNYKTTPTKSQRPF